MKKTKILLSAYACEPNRGSEPGIGWNWALQLNKLGYDIKVVTRLNNKIQIEKYLKKKRTLNNKNFYYYDLPKIFQFFKKKIPGGVYIYYYLWQFFLYHNLKKQKFLNNYQLVHHLTFGTIKMPSFLWKLDKKFIFGPVGGYEIISNQLKNIFSFKDKLFEYVRELSNLILLNYDKNLINCFINSNLIFTRTNHTKDNLKKYIKNKIFVNQDIGCNNIYKKKEPNKISKFLFVARFVNWKGGDLLIDAFNEALKINNKLNLNFYGSGKQKKYWQKKIAFYGLEKKIKIVGFIEHKNIDKVYRSHDVFVFPSFHDSGGTAVVEALSYSLPVICLNLGGPGEIIDKSCGLKIPISKNTNKKILIKELSKNIIKISNNKKLYKKLSNGAYAKAKSYNWNKIVKKAYKVIQGF
jgi:glycosyltransferase involved in cell wall biosynthesis